MPDVTPVVTTYDEIVSAARKAWSEKRLGYQLPYASGCSYRYYGIDDQPIGCCAIGAIMPDDFVKRAGPRTFDLDTTVDYLIDKGFLVVPAEDVVKVVKLQIMHDKCLVDDQTDKANAIRRFEIEIGVREPADA